MEFSPTSSISGSLMMEQIVITMIEPNRRNGKIKDIGK
jgi:hypothetical protein